MTKNKRGQISEGLTWVVATIAIIIILLISVFITSTVFDMNNREIKPQDFTIGLNEKSLMGYLLTKDSDGKIVYLKIKEDGNLKGFNGDLSVKIFKGLYEEEYSGIWVGVSELGNIIGGREENEFFDRSSLTGEESYFVEIKFAEEKIIEGAFVK